MGTRAAAVFTTKNSFVALRLHGGNKKKIIGHLEENTKFGLQNTFPTVEVYLEPVCGVRKPIGRNLVS